MYLKDKVMKKNKLFYIVGFIIILLNSCKTIEMSDLKPVNRNANLIPTLEPQIDTYSFQSAFSLGSSSSSGFGSSSLNGTSSGFVSTGFYSGQAVFKADKRIQDVITVFERDVRENICNNNQEKKGYIVCKIPFIKSKAKNWGLIIFPFAVTDGISSLFGIPIYHYQTEVEMEVEILDLNKKSIARYAGYGKAKIPVALYHGYSAPIWNSTGNEGGVRKSNILAIKIALNEIKQKIEKDNVMLNEKLK